MMSDKKFCMWIMTALTCLQKGITSPTWVRETSIADGLSIAGRLGTIDHVNLGQCIVECFMDESCITVGMSGHGCQLYDLDLQDHQHMSAQINTVFYKAVCSHKDYTYIRKLHRCIKRNAAYVTFEEARATCQSDGGDLLMVKTNDLRLYLKEVILDVTDTSQYWLGGSRDSGNSSIWHWLDGTQITKETGEDFWAPYSPSSNPASDRLQFRSTGYGDVLFDDRESSNEAGVLCEVPI